MVNRSTLQSVSVVASWTRTQQQRGSTDVVISPNRNHTGDGKMFDNLYYEYCNWNNRECIYIDYLDKDKLGYTSICMICQSNVRHNYPFEGGN